MITEVKTIKDLQSLPAYLQHALRPAQPRTHRYLNAIEKAERKTRIQQAVVKAVEEQAISYALGVEILQANTAFGPDGKKAMKAVSHLAQGV